MTLRIRRYEGISLANDSILMKYLRGNGSTHLTLGIERNNTDLMRLNNVFACPYDVWICLPDQSIRHQQ